MRRVIMIAPAFPPQSGVGAQRPAKLAKYLREYGWEPLVMAMPVPDGATQDTMMGREVSTITVDRPHLRSIPGVNDRSIRWLPSAWQALQQLVQQSQAEAIYITGGPFPPFVLPWLLSRRGGPAYVLDYRDPWINNPYFSTRTLKSKLALSFYRGLERRCIDRARFVVTVSRMMTDDLAATQRGQDASKFVTIYNGFDEEDFVDLTPAPLERDMWNVIYMGTAAKPHHPFDGILEAVARFTQTRRELAERFRLHLVGHVSPEYVARIQQLDLGPWVRCHGVLPHVQALKVLAAGDASLLLIQSPGGPDSARYDVSGKLFNYLRAGKPILATVPPGGEASEILTQSGLFVDIGGSIETVARSFELAMLGSRVHEPNRPFIMRFSRRLQAGQLANLLAQCPSRAR